MKVNLKRDAVYYVAEIKYNDSVLDALTIYDVIPGDYVQTNIDENLYEVIKIKPAPKDENKLPQIKVKGCVIDYKSNKFNDSSKIYKSVLCYTPTNDKARANVNFEPKIGDMVFINKNYYYIEKIFDFVYPNFPNVVLAYRYQDKKATLLMRSSASLRCLEHLYDIKKISKPILRDNNETQKLRFESHDALFIGDNYIFGYSDDKEMNVLINKGRSNDIDAINSLIEINKGNNAKYNYWLKRKTMLEEEKS